MNLLDNIAWHTLTGPQARFATGTGDARRYAAGFSPILAFANLERPDFASLRSFCPVGEHFYCGSWSGPATDGWRIDIDTTMHQMIWDGPMPAEDPTFDAVRLGSEHVAQMLDLVALTNPGPFGARTVELGEYFGCFEGQRLIAMAGERMCAGALREISGVCVHPDTRGQRLASRLIEKLLRREMQRGETPFLHVMAANTNARRIYERMGFRYYQETTVRVLSRLE